jgi:hypothetical protein
VPKPLNEVPWEELRYGDRLRSAVGNLGVIYELQPNKDPDKCLVHIIWENHKKSIQPQNLLEAVTWLGPRVKEEP